MATCKNDCLHSSVCRLPFNTSNTQVEFAQVCHHFKNKADFAEVKHGEIKYINRPTPAKFAYVKGADGVMYYGKLFDKMDYNPVPYCSICSKRLDDNFQNYCPYCGAKLEGFKSMPADAEEILKNIMKEGEAE